MMTGYGYGGIGMMGPFGWLGGILLLVLIVLAIVWLWRALELGRGVRQGGETRADRALDIARERYASGEIDSQEFERLRSDLASSAGALPGR